MKILMNSNFVKNEILHRKYEENTKNLIHLLKTKKRHPNILK